MLVAVGVASVAALLAAVLTEAADCDAVAADERSDVEEDEVGAVVIISVSFRL